MKSPDELMDSIFNEFDTDSKKVVNKVIKDVENTVKKYFIDEDGKTADILSAIHIPFLDLTKIQARLALRGVRNAGWDASLISEKKTIDKEEVTHWIITVYIK